MRILAIDPGTDVSGVVVYDMEGKRVDAVFSEIDNRDLMEFLIHGLYAKGERITVAAIEMVASYGMPVGREVFETCVWIGRFLQTIGEDRTNLIYRRDVKLNLCGQPRAKDANIRQAILDRFGGKEAAMGTKKAPGPLYGVSKHAWAALAVALTYADLNAK